MHTKKILAIATGAVLAMQLLADADDFARALARWQRRPSLASALHVATSGLFLASDVAALR